MISKHLLKEAKTIENTLINIRHHLHANPEIGFDLPKTKTLVQEELQNMGYAPINCGKSGVIALAGGTKPGKVFLLRADMDALPIKEEAVIDYASTNNNMHACGHDMHTTMLLGAAKLLKEHEDEIEGTVKLMFQPAEELLEGSKDMIEHGVLQNPSVDAALMMHVMTAVPIPTGTIVACDGGVSAPAADYFTIQIHGKGCHGSTPNKGIDPITVAAHIVIGLQEISARELFLFEPAVLTIGTIQAGIASNVIPDTAILKGTLRAYDDQTREYIKKRLNEITLGIAESFRAKAFVTFPSGCPTLINNPNLSQCTLSYVQELLGSSMAFPASQLNTTSDNGKEAHSSGSEDFAYISQEIPSIMLAIAAGEPRRGFEYPLHHPKVTFDDSVLSIGSAVYAYTALRWLQEHK
ncbi:MAG: amidohydrolase [Lachnospiraceae bacterium]|nr:amidohydrolase [Lachnospiraceae bacterium]